MLALWIDLAVILILIVGIAQFRTPRGARHGNLTAAAALLAAVVIVLVRNGVLDARVVVLAALVGSGVGAWIAARVNMIQIPAMVAFQHGAGGIAAFLVSFVELTRDAAEPLTPVAESAALLGLIVGAGTFSGSMIASGKLANRLRQTPTLLPYHNAWLLANVVVLVALGVWAGVAENPAVVWGTSLALIIGATVLGAVFAIRIGGADMPVLISTLNATAGLAAAFCGIAIGNRLLIACGATVAASGSILTHVMCQAMNRKLVDVLTGLRHLPARGPTPGPLPAGAAAPAWTPAGAAVENGARAQDPSAATTGGAPEPAPRDAAPAATGGTPEPRAAATTAAPAGTPTAESGLEPGDPTARAVDLLRAAERVIVVPGYGMALADASEEVVQLGERLSGLGKDVLFAIHPVAGRMPGHMHVLLAEADVDYDQLRELKDVNDDFAAADVALIVGACDVVNPAAIEQPDTPISGMPILRAHEARHVIVCNLDERPGYSGVPNPLYHRAKTILLLGDAQETVAALRAGLEAATGATSP